MIELMFEFGGDAILIIIRNHSVKFGNTAYGVQMADIAGLKLDKKGVLKEFPDLETNENWRAEAIKRFKEKIQALDTEDEISNYIISDLRKYGYKPRFRQKAGFRKEVING